MLQERAQRVPPLRNLLCLTPQRPISLSRAVESLIKPLTGGKGSTLRCSWPTQRQTSRGNQWEPPSVSLSSRHLPCCSHLQLDFQLFALIILNCTFPICSPIETPSDPLPLQISHPCGFPCTGGRKLHTGNMQSGYMLILTLSVSGEQ